jgi:TRAP-type C4-dicarboxylate transport system permease small subunit
MTPLRLVARLEDALTYVSGLLIFLTMLFICVVIAARAVGVGIVGFIDVIEQTMVGFVFLGLARGQRRGEHLRMDLLVRRAPPRLARALDVGGSLVGLAVCLVLIPPTWAHFLRAYEIGDTTIDAQLPTWPSKLVVPVALALLALRLTIQFLATAAGDRRPAAVSPAAGEGDAL